MINYLDYLNWTIDKKKTQEYLLLINEKQSLSSFRKKSYQIRKFLLYLKIDWANDIQPPKEPVYYVKIITRDHISDCLLYFKKKEYCLQCNTIIHLGASSGLRAEELYQLTLKDIDLDKRIIHINHDPQNGQTTKTKQSRISFITKYTKDSLLKYFNYYNQNDNSKKLFPQNHISKRFRDAPIHVKDLRKYFSQEWDRRGGPTSIKKILMGHSLKGDVDLMHYNAQSEDDLKRIYDRVMGAESNLKEGAKEY